MKKIIGLLALCLALPLWAATPAVVSLSELAPTVEQKRATELITHFMSNYHYKRTSLNDGMSVKIFERYLENVDPNKSYLSKDDIAKFDKYRSFLDDALLSNQMEPAFEIFKLFRTRLEQRVEKAIGLLDYAFDYSIDEDYRFDRSKADWAASQQDLDEVWRKRVKNDVLNLRLAGKEDADIRETLKKRYERIITRVQQLESDDVYQLFINSYTNVVEPHTSYFSPRTSENFKIRMSLSLEGIGAVLQTDNEFTLVTQVVAGGPAEMSKELHAKDRIIGVGEGADSNVENVVGWRLDDVVDLIRGAKGTTVRLELLPRGVGPEGPSKFINLVRDKIKLEEQAAKYKILEIDEGEFKAKIGVIDVPAFYLDFDARARGESDYRSTTKDVRKLLAELKEQQISGIVIDLRGNGGGSLTEATDLTGLFIESGPVVQVKDSAGRIDINADRDPSIEYTGPMAVLVDHNSASASEIFAGAMQDYHRAIIIGESTFGKGTVQNLIDLDRFIDAKNSGLGHLGQLKATIAQFFRINGDSTQHRGVVPDIVYPTAEHRNDIGERALDNALPWASVMPAHYTMSNAPVSIYGEIREEHEKRIQDDAGFVFLKEQAEAIEKAQNKDTVSLLEQKRKDEWKINEDEALVRQNRYRLSRGLEPLKKEDLNKDPEEDQIADNVDSADKEEEKAEDVLLQEAAQILTDLIVRSGVPGLLHASVEENGEQVLQSIPADPVYAH